MAARQLEITISTLAPREGSDAGSQSNGGQVCRFQPSLPARGATNKPKRRSAGQWISTLAPREGSDW